jgi:predicted transcriptional regulator
MPTPSVSAAPVPPAPDQAALRAHARKIVVAFLERNAIAREELGPLVSTTLASLAREAALAAAAPEPNAAAPAAAVPARPFVTHDDPSCVVCLEDGLKFRSLRRHLFEAHGLSPAQYRARWDLADDHPLVAAELSQARSARARAVGFGKRGK